MKIKKGIFEGLIYILIGFLIFYLRPFNDCHWYNIGCQVGGTLITPIFLVLMIILIIVGVVKILRK